MTTLNAIALSIATLQVFTTRNMCSAQQPTWAWAKSAAGEESENGAAVAVDSQGNVYVAGTFNSPTVTLGNESLTYFGGDGPDIFVVKYASTGTVQWVRQAGGLSYDEVFDLLVNDQDELILIGQSASQIQNFGIHQITNPEDYDYNVFVTKFSTDGNFLWANGFGSDEYDFPRATTLDEDGNIIVAGTFAGDSVIIGNDVLHIEPSFGNGRDVFCAKLSAAGLPLWARSFGGNSDDNVFSLASDAEQNIYLCGSYAGHYIIVQDDTLANNGALNANSAFLIQFQDDGNQQWIKTWGGDNQAFYSRLFQLPSGAIGLTGTATYSEIQLDGLTITNPGTNAFIAGYNADGTANWATMNAAGFGVKSVDPSGVLYFIGTFANTSFSVDGFTIDNSDSNGGTTDMYVYAADTLGNVHWLIGAGGAWFGYDQPSDISAGPNGTAYFSGNFDTYSCTFGSNTLMNENTGTVDAFVAKLNGVGLPAAMKEPAPALNFSIQPNPCNDVALVTIQPGHVEPCEVRVNDSTGRTVLSLDTFSSTSLEMDLSQLTSGIYSVTLSSEKIRLVKTLIKQ